MNRADPALLKYMQYPIDQCNPDQGPMYKLAEEFGQQLLDSCRQVVGQSPLSKDGKYRSISPIFGSNSI